MFNDGIHIVTSLRSNIRQHLILLYDKLMLHKRNIIECCQRHIESCDPTRPYPPPYHI
ncbi:transposase [Parabacteroides johnsonii]|uniref:transposase n=1 Tax=Parabacteroides johnsonii TaxID=387661 RepID=UPI003AB1E831